MNIEFQPMTIDAFDEWVLLPQNRDRRFEFVSGKVIELVSNDKAARIGAWLLVKIGAYVIEHKLGKIKGPDGGYIVEGERYIPDVGFVSRARWQDAGKVAYYPLAPDLAVEVISDKRNIQEMDTLRKKISSYTAAGTVVWIVDPDEAAIEVYKPGQKPVTLGKGDTLSGDDVLPGFTLAVADVFEEA